MQETEQIILNDSQTNLDGFANLFDQIFEHNWLQRVMHLWMGHQSCKHNARLW